MSVIVDAATPRSLDAPVIKFNTKGAIVVASGWGTLAAGVAAALLISFHWVTFGFCAVADIGLLVMVARVLVCARRTRRVWRLGTLTEVKVRASTLAWKDYHGGAYTLELELAGGSTLAFDYAQGQQVGRSHPALVHDGWILIVFDVGATALKQMPDQSRVSK